MRAGSDHVIDVQHAARLRRKQRPQNPVTFDKRLLPEISAVEPQHVESEVVLRELSVAVRSSETVALRHPIMPVGNGFGGRLVRVYSRQLG